MTIASKLFYCRRTTPRRSSEQEPLDPFDVDCDATRGRHRLPRDGRDSHEEQCGLSKRRLDHGPSHAKAHLLHRSTARTLQESIRLNRRASTEIREGNHRNGRHMSSGVRRSFNAFGDKMDGRLPDSVLQAQMRLLERLRGVNLTGSRQEYSDTGIAKDEYSYAEELSISDSGHRKAGNGSKMLESGDQVSEVIAQSEQVPSVHDVNKKPCVLGHLLDEEVSYCTKCDGVPKDTLDCSICLEKFLEGEELIRLRCGHMYHHACLGQWMQTHGHCPYCRTSVIG